MIYKINDNNEIFIWAEESDPDKDTPMLYQPTWPNGTSWESFEQAENWANVYINSLNVELPSVLPGSSPEEPIVILPEIVEELVAEPIIEEPLPLAE
jgi:hypothetical protein